MRVRGQEQTVPLSACTAASTTQSLQERSHFHGSVDLDDPVEISNIDPQLQGAGCDDNAIASVLEGLFRAETFITAEGAVRDKRLRSLAAQKRSQFLRLRAAIRKHQP